MADPDIPSNDVDTLKAAGEGGCWRFSFKGVSRVSWEFIGWEAFIWGARDSMKARERDEEHVQASRLTLDFFLKVFVYGRTNLEVYNVESNWISTDLVFFFFLRIPDSRDLPNGFRDPARALALKGVKLNVLKTPQKRFLGLEEEQSFPWIMWKKSYLTYGDSVHSGWMYDLRLTVNVCNLTGFLHWDLWQSGWSFQSHVNRGLFWGGFQGL